MGSVMHQDSLQHLLIEQMDGLQHRHRDLELVLDSGGTFWVRGPVRFSDRLSQNLTKGEYEIELEISNVYPDAPPLVRETSGQVGAGFHRMSSTGLLCLGAPVEVKRVWAEDRSLLGFVDRLVVPYLFSYSYYKEHGSMPFGELAHEPPGLLDYYNEVFGATDDLVSLRLLVLLTGNRQSQGAVCPCGSDLPLRECHGATMGDLSKYQSSEDFYLEAGQILAMFQEGGRNARHSANGAKWGAGLSQRIAEDPRTQTEAMATSLAAGSV